jgi:hypothetical protein
MPPGEDRGKLREMVATRGISLDFWFKLKGTLSQHAFSKHMTDYFEQTHVALSSTQGTMCIQRYLPGLAHCFVSDHLISHLRRCSLLNNEFPARR